MNTFIKFTSLLFLLLFGSEANAQSCHLGRDCITDLTQKDCPSGYYLKENSAVGGCCPKCEEVGYVPDFCGITGEDCPIGMYCTDQYQCQLNKTSCFSYLHAKVKPKYPPSCEMDGTYSAVQCKGDALSGRCFCSDEAGKRIFGMAWTADAADMTCACSRRRTELERAGRADVTLHCDSNGNYEKLQCDSGLCWCVGAKTGDPVSAAVQADLVAQLPCFDWDTFGSQYLRVCESKSHAVAAMKDLLALHGTGRVTMESANCDYDGSYGVYQIDKGIAYCSWKDSSRLGSWAMQAGTGLSSMNCNCARDTKYFEDAGKTMTLSCSGNGNYMQIQQIDGDQYCVDEDGYSTTDLFDSGTQAVCPEN